MATPAKSDPVTDFAWAVKTGDLDSVKDFVEKQKLDVNLVDASITKRSPLHWAADFNQVAVITYLISKGATVDKKGNPFWSQLILYFFQPRYVLSNNK
jgi:ankyrin repeat protein